MILPILTYSSAVKTIFSNTQLMKFSSIDNRASLIVGKASLKSVKESIDNQISSTVLKCLRKELCHDVWDSYFQRQSHKKCTRNNGWSLKVPKIKLEISRPSFYFGGVKVFNNLPLESRKSILE